LELGQSVCRTTAVCGQVGYVVRFGGDSGRAMGQFPEKLGGGGYGRVQYRRLVILISLK
jgi:hypothetical protein